MYEILAIGVAIGGLCFAVSAPAIAAGSSVGYGNGGAFSRFDPIVQQYNQSGELFQIQGHCQSTCTIFLSIRNVCVERSATLLFHAGRPGTNIPKRHEPHDERLQ